MHEKVLDESVLKKERMIINMAKVIDGKRIAAEVRG